jgi:hypothetical protein
MADEKFSADDVERMARAITADVLESISKSLRSAAGSSQDGGYLCESAFYCGSEYNCTAPHRCKAKYND